VKIAGRAEYSDAKTTKDALLAFVSATAIVLVTAYTPDNCLTAKCKLGAILIGSSPLANFWFASFFGGLTTLGSLLALYLVVNRRSALRG
ncbi:hypothetical protein ACCS91_38750, partial [Rhizobium ruizarguesonis]